VNNFSSVFVLEALPYNQKSWSFFMLCGLAIERNSFVYAMDECAIGSSCWIVLFDDSPEFS
jgi:hypothetical protein